MKYTAFCDVVQRHVLRLRYRLAAAASRGYVEAGFTVVFEDVIAGPMLTEVIDLLGGGEEQVIVLMPSREAIHEREDGRDVKAYGAWSVDQLYDLFERDTPRIGWWLDTSEMTPEQTVDVILARFRQLTPTSQADAGGWEARRTDGRSGWPNLLYRALNR